MKKFCKIISFALCIVLSFSLIACTKTNSNSDEDFQEGVEYGMAEVFMALNNASNIDKTKLLLNGDVWETKHFSLIYTNEQIDNETYLKYDLTLNNITMEECIEYGMMFFNIYSVTDTQWDMVLGYYDDYYVYALLENEYPLGYNAKGTVKLYDDALILVTIIVIDGCFYTAEYYL